MLKKRINDKTDSDNDFALDFDDGEVDNEDALKEEKKEDISNLKDRENKKKGKNAKGNRSISDDFKCKEEKSTNRGSEQLDSNIRVVVICMEKKRLSKPMKMILGYLDEYKDIKIT